MGPTQTGAGGRRSGRDPVTSPNSSPIVLGFKICQSKTHESPETTWSWEETWLLIETPLLS
jgi:hypothetical protein